MVRVSRGTRNGQCYPPLVLVVTIHIHRSLLVSLSDFLTFSPSHFLVGKAGQGRVGLTLLIGRDSSRRCGLHICCFLAMHGLNSYWPSNRAALPLERPEWLGAPAYLYYQRLNHSVGITAPSWLAPLPSLRGPFPSFPLSPSPVLIRSVVSFEK